MKQAIVFKEWAPDAAALGNPLLVEAKNVVPESDYFAPYHPLSSLSTAAPQAVLGGFVAKSTAGAIVYAGDTTAIWQVGGGGGGWIEVSGATYGVATDSSWSFVQFDNLVIAAHASQRLIGMTIGAATVMGLLSISGEAPFADYVHAFKRFVFALNSKSTTTSITNAVLRWSAIDNARNWPTPNSATAIATQSGEQQFDNAKGNLVAMRGTDQFALVFQPTAITRMTFVGPPAVFQFDLISDEIGTLFPYGTVQVQNKIYFLSQTGVYVSDGVSVINIGTGKVNFWLKGNAGMTEAMTNSTWPLRISTASDPVKKLIYWGFPSSTSAGEPVTILIYNYETNNFSWASENHRFLMSAHADSGSYTAGSAYAFDADSGYNLAQFAGSPGTATLETGDVQLNPMGRGFVSGVKPNIEGSAAVSIGVQVGTRDGLDTASSFSATAAPFADTDVANFRADGKYHRARVIITGAFNRATGIEFDAIPSSER